jgi:membrane fusion protein, macrolide-specific efflux system
MKKISKWLNTAKNWFVRRNKITKIFFVVILIAVSYFVYKKLTTSTSSVSYQTAKAEKGTLVVSVSASGTVTGANITTVTTEASGTVRKVYVKEGDSVKVGQKIADVDLDLGGSQQYAQAYASWVSANNQVNSANNSLRSAQASLDNVYDQIKGHDNDESLTMKETRTKAEVSRDNAYDSVKNAQANLTTSSYNLKASSGSITAPTSGKIASLTIAEGSALGSQTTTSGTRTSQRVGSIIKTGNPIVTVNLSEIDIPNVKVGQKATVIFDSISDKSFTGEVVAIDRVGSTTSNVTNYPALIKLDSNSDQILPNMAVTANIIIDVKDNVVMIPSSAISQTSSQLTVKVMKSGVATSVNVEIGKSSDTQTEIISGISEGDEVVTSTSTTGTSSTTTSTKSVFSSGLGGAGRALGR